MLTMSPAEAALAKPGPVTSSAVMGKVSRASMHIPEEHPSGHTRVNKFWERLEIFERKHVFSFPGERTHPNRMNGINKANPRPLDFPRAMFWREAMMDLQGYMFD